MANQQHRQTAPSRTREQSRDRVFGKTLKPGFSRVPVRQAVFSLSHSALQGFLDIVEVKKYPDIEPEEVKDDLLDEEADMDDLDNDEPRKDIEPGDWYSNRHLARLRESFEFAGLPVVELGDKYSISISEKNHHNYTCNFQEPTWFHRTMNTEAGPYIVRLVLFIRSLGEWFEEERQLYLDNPTPLHFVSIDASYPKNPVVLQNGLLARINARLPEYHQLTEQDFSRLVDKVWLLWPKWCMPLRSVFSKEYRKEWVIQGCLHRYKITGVWIKELSTDFTKKDMRQIKRKNFASLALEEMFRLLCDIVGANQKETLEMVKNRIQQAQEHGS